MDEVVHLALLAEAEEPGVNVLLLVGVVLHAARHAPGPLHEM